VIVSGKDLVHDGTAVQTQSTGAVKGKT